MFRSIKNFFLDFAVPIGLSIVNPALGAAYSGIKTGIQTGSPLAGIGAAGLSLATSSAFKGLGPAVKGPTQMVTEASKEAGIQAASKASETALGSGIAKGFRSAIDPAFTGAARAATESLTPNVIERVGGSIFDTATQGTFAGGLPANTIAGKGVRMLPEFIQEASPLAVGAGSFALKEMATPPPPPAPIGNMQAPKRDFSKYAYKGPLQRGEYTYADPEDIAYGRTTNYGYLGAKEGGVIKAQGGGVMMQRGLLDPSIEATKGTFRAPESMGVIPGKLSQVAQTQPGMMPKPQQMQTMAQPIAPTVPLNMPMSQPQPPVNLPMQGLEQQAQQLINNLPKKDLNVNVSSQLQQAFGQLGLAQGGEVPGMAKNTGQQITGQSSGIGSGVYNNSMNEKQFIDSFLSILPNNLAGNVVRELGLGEQVGQQMYQQYSDSNKKQMAQGGEVESNQELQENAFVIPADVVGHIGDGSSDAGAQRLQSYLGMNPQQYQAGGIMAGELQGPGGGMDDLIQTSIEGKRAAAVSPQEFVVPRDIVAELGQGSYDKGSNKLYALMKNVRKEKTGTSKQPAELQRGLGQLMRTAAA
tara:strand:+ start:65 stop:1816 length:1752 start_codon:yes stop_codon:yes gene_type:complete